MDRNRHKLWEAWRRRLNQAGFAFLFPFFIFYFPFLTAQPVDEPPTVETVFKTMSIGRGDFSGIKVQAKEDEQPVSLSFSQYQRSQPIEYEGPVPIVFFREKPNPDPALPPIRIPVGSVNMNIKNPVKEALFLFLPVAQESDSLLGGDLPGPKYKVYTLDDSLRAFPRDSLIVFNATGANLFGQVVGREMLVPDGATGPFDLSRNFTAAFAIQTRDGPKLVFENVLQFSGEQRVIFMLRPPKRRGSLRIQAFAIPESLDSPPPP